MKERAATAAESLAIGVGVVLVATLAWVFANRFSYPYDLEWMEGGMLAHAWRIAHGQPIYTEPGPDWVPYIYPPGYPALLAILSPVFGLSATVGRVVSILSTIAASVGIGVAVHERTKSAWGALIGAFVFLSCYTDSGSFYDLVRNDSLLVALIAGAIACASAPGARRTVAAGLLLAAATLVKHNAIGFVPALALWIGLRDGVAAAAMFSTAYGVPTAIAIGYLQISSEGRFLKYLLEVPRSHPTVKGRVLPGTAWELGEALPFASSGIVCAAACVAAREQRVRTAVAIGSASVLVGILGSRLGMPIWEAIAPKYVGMLLDGVVDGAGGLPIGGVIGDALGFLLTASGFALLGGGAAAAAGLLDLRRPAELTNPQRAGLAAWAALAAIAGRLLRAVAPAQLDSSVPVVLALGVGIAGAGGYLLYLHGPIDRRNADRIGLAGLCAAAFAIAAVMRGHQGGFINVHMPAFLVIAIVSGIAAARMESPPTRIIASLFAIAQLAWGAWRIEPDKLIPNPSDVAAGDALVAALRDRADPVLSPYAPWLAVQAGHPPGPHLIAIWDVTNQKQPTFPGVKKAFEDAAKAHHWAAVADAPRSMGYGVRSAYEVGETMTTPLGAGDPKTGWKAHPRQILVPKGSE